MGKIAENLNTRLWRFVDRRGPDECWLWKGAGGAYGFIRVKGKNLYAHRVSWVLENGEIPDGLWVLHRCDVPRCVNPKHLFLGTSQDNADDCTTKGRRPIGERNGLHKLTVFKVREMRILREQGRSLYQLAKMFSVTPQTVHAVVRNEVWKHA